MAKTVAHMTSVHHPFDTRIYHKECRSLQHAGYDVTLIAPETDSASEINILPIKKYTNKFLRMAFSTYQVYKQARQLDADYYHFHDPELLPIGWLLKKKNNVVIYDIHEDYATSIMQKEYIPRPIRKLITKTYKRMENVLGRDMAFCLAEKYYEELYPHGQTILNYPLLDQSLLNKEVSEDVGQPENKLLYTGNIDVDRGAYVQARLPLIDEEITVYFFGKCSREVADNMYETAGAEKDRLIIEGIERYVPREDIDHQYMNRRWLAGLALFPPTDHYKRKELTKFFEYMSAGIPILCSNFPVWQAFIDRYQCGIAVDPQDKADIQDALEYLRLYPEEAAKMGRNGQKAVREELNWQKEEEKLLQWYDELSRKAREIGDEHAK
ncbi:glycosyltransferase [Natribacillus halophilus]|uniref:Glycosyltransferase involved in cell wall bisynthesis n=1 Tax=Natribacillus halophilus TaxID=549003 RepID=A0A1G8S9R5_9BACI|nr:glycosyltransferase [Natribacillus halophilus]SDJ25944.1 Glycosyltransferase involved in cell wall bisynthesis [Natribacillus halophilus]